MNRAKKDPLSKTGRVIHVSLSDRERDTVLAALAMWHHAGCRSGDPTINEIASNGDLYPPLTEAEVDALCDRLNQ